MAHGSNPERSNHVFDHVTDAGGGALLLPIHLVSDVYGVWKYRESHSIQNLFILIPAAAIGVFAGWLFAGDTDEDVVRVFIGCVGLIFLVMRQWGRLGAAVSRAL